MKTPSAYPVLDNRPIDQWRVTELKEELKRRKLATKGLKDDLVKRLDEALRVEVESVKEVDVSDVDIASQLVVHTDGARIHDGTPPPVAHTGDSEVLDGTSRTVLHAEEVGVLDGSTQHVVNPDDEGETILYEKTVGVMHHGSNQEIEGSQGTSSPGSVRNVETLVQVASVETNITRNEELPGKGDDQDGEGDADSLMNEETSVLVTPMETISTQNEVLPSKGDEQDGVETVGTDFVRNEDTLVPITSVESSITVNESVTHEVATDVEESLKNDLQNMRVDLKTGLENQESGPPLNVVESKSSDPSIQVSVVSTDLEFQATQLETEAKPPQDDVELNNSYPNNQVSEVSTVLGFQVKSDSISSDCVSINEKNEIKDNIIDDNITSELDIKPEMVHPSSSNVLSDGSKPHLTDVEDLYYNKGPVEGDEKTANSEISKKNESLDAVSPEKLNFDRSSGDDSMEDDTMQNKPLDSNYDSGVVGDQGEKNEVPVSEEEAPVDVVSDNIPADKKVTIDKIKEVPAAPVVKRKLHDQEGVGNNETSKRQRRWNAENLKAPEPQSNVASSTTPKDTFPLKRNFLASDPAASDEPPKERVVPPSAKPSTTSLRIDRFLRPFTLKAVKELLGKTGNVTSFWMDHIKTHCYVTYSSVEEAIDTRNALYNLQWPANGGRLLSAEFVDPHEVKMRVDAPPQSPATPASTGSTLPPLPPSTVQHQAPPRQQVQRQPLPPPPSLPLPPPPPLSNPPQARERLPPPPPRAEKIDPPIVTLDDLFRKTKATPRIYYLPLSDEEVAARLKVRQQGKNTRQ